MLNPVMEEKQINETEHFASYWQELIDNLYVFSELENQNEKLEKQNGELLSINKKLLCENERLKKRLIKLEEKIKTLGDSERTLKLAQNKSAQADKTFEEAKIKMKQMEHLKYIAETLISDYHQKTLKLQEKLNAVSMEGGDNSE